MSRLRLLLCFLLLGAGAAVLAAQSDLDTFMEQALSRRDDNWRKLQQYVLDERQAWEVTGPGRVPVWGDRREFTWFIQDGFFVRSPVKFNGVSIGERERREYEARFLASAREREKKGQGAGAADLPPVDTPSNLSGLLSQNERPEFVSAAYFLRFKFDAGRYALVGREPLQGRDVLKIEYYPTRLFSEESREAARQESRRREPERERSARDRATAEQMRRLMNTRSKVTLWIDPSSHQVMKYTFDDLGWDFLPGQWLLQMESVTATMTVGEMFPDVWLPRTIEMRAQMGTAAGAVNLAFATEYHNYRKADVSATIGIPGGQ